MEETIIDATKEVPSWTYTIDPLTGEVTFIPNKDFVGTPDAVNRSSQRRMNYCDKGSTLTVTGSDANRRR